MDRRDFLEGTAGATLAGLVPFLTAASREGWTEAHVAGFLERLDRRVERARAHGASVRLRRLRDEDDDAPPIAAALEEAMPAVLAVNVVGQIPVRVQAHPDVQRVLAGHLETVGRTARVVADGLRAFRDAEEDLPADTSTRDAAIGALSAELSLEDLPEGVRQRLEDGLRRAGWDFRHRPLRALVDEQLARFDQAVALAGRPDEALASMAVRDPQALAEATGDEPPVPTKVAPTDVLLGMLLLGVGTAAGGVLVVLGVALVICPCIGIPVFLAGVLILYLCWAVGLDLLSPPLEYDVPVGRWIHTGVRVRRRKGFGSVRVTKLRAEGEVTLAPGILVGPEGHDGPWDGPLPAADEPAGALLVRVDGETFHPQLDASLGKEGPLELAVNARAEEGASGGFRVRITHARAPGR